MREPIRLRNFSVGVLALAFLIGHINPAAPQTDLSGTISSDTVLGPTGDLQDTLFNVVGAVTVDAGVTLTIQPGVSLRFDVNANTSLNVNGTLLAQGTAADRITFTRLQDSGN